MGRTSLRLAAIAAALLLVGCASSRHERGDRPGGPGGHREEEWHPPSGILLRYADKDGNVTRAEMEAGLKADFAAADTNHDGVLEADEVRAVNQKRWNEDRSAASPLVDWNGDGVVDFNEFSANARALFDQLDVDGKGVLTAKQLKPQSTGVQSKPGGDSSGEHRRGRRGGGQGGDQGGGQGGGGGPDGDGQ